MDCNECETEEKRIFQNGTLYQCLKSTRSIHYLLRDCLVCNCWAVTAAMVVLGIMALHLTIEQKDMLNHYPCTTIRVWGSLEGGSKAAIYRRIEWEWEGENYGRNILVDTCNYKIPEWCFSDDVGKLNLAKLYLNRSESCWIHTSTGQYYESILVTEGNDPVSTRNSLGIPALVFMIACLLLTGLIFWFSRTEKKYSDILNSRPERHFMHTDTMLIFLLGLRQPNSSLNVLKNSQIYDKHVTGIIYMYISLLGNGRDKLSHSSNF